MSLHGELDLASAPLLREEIEGAEAVAAELLVLDLEDLKFIDSTGLRVVLEAHERAGEREQRFAVTRGSQQVQRLLSVTGVDEHLRILASPEDLLV